MKVKQFLTTVLVLGPMILSGCGGAPATGTASPGQSSVASAAGEVPAEQSPATSVSAEVPASQSPAAAPGSAVAQAGGEKTKIS